MDSVMMKFDEQSKKNIRYLNLLVIVLTVRMIMEFFSAFLGTFLRMNTTSSFTIFFYVFLFVLMIASFLRTNAIEFKSLLLLWIMYVFFGVSYLFSSQKELFVSNEMLVIYLFYLPFSVLILSNITDWSKLADVAKKYIKFDIVLGLITAATSVLYGSIRLTTNSSYMGYSYTMLPILCLAYLSNQKEKQVIVNLLIILGSLSIVVYGARTCILFLILFVVIVSFGVSSLRARLAYIGVLLFTSFFLSSLMLNDTFIRKLYEFSLNYNSHIVSQFLDGELFSSKGRDTIYKIIRTAIEWMPSGGYGLFGDRLFVKSYSHSIVYESIISFGWVRGVTFLSAIFFGVVMSFVKALRGGEGQIYLLAFLSFFCKFFISSSFVCDWSFYVFLGFTFSILWNRKGQIL